MSESLRDLLLKSGIAKKVPKVPRAAHGKAGKASRPAAVRPSPQADENIDLARAYALRAQTEARERARSKREAEQHARARKEARRKLQALLDGKALNRADAERLRHFEYHGKIRRVHVDDAQLRALNAGELGVVQFGGRYLLVDASIARTAGNIDPDALALLLEPGMTDDDDVPADLVW